MEPFSLVRELEVDASSSGIIELYEVPGGRVLKLKKVKVKFADDCDYSLSLALLYGNVQIAPTYGKIIGDDEEIEVAVDWEFQSNTFVKLWYENTAATKVHATVTLEGELD